MSLQVRLVVRHERGEGLSVRRVEFFDSTYRIETEPDIALFPAALYVSVAELVDLAKMPDVQIVEE